MKMTSSNILRACGWNPEVEEPPLIAERVAKYAAKNVWNAAIQAAMAECTINAKRQKGSVGARTCFEIKDAIFEHLIMPEGDA